MNNADEYTIDSMENTSLLGRVTLLPARDR
jgi:hypothetical protein